MSNWFDIAVTRFKDQMRREGFTFSPADRLALIRKQEDPLPYGDRTTSSEQGAVLGAAGGEGSSESVGWSGRHVSEAVAASVDTNHQGGNEANPPADKVIPFIEWFKPIWRDFYGQS